MRVMKQGMLGLNGRSLSERRVENGTVDRAQRSFDDGVLSGNVNGRTVRGGNGRVATVSAPGQVSQGASVCWERFLHVTTLRVLLVENDDSTRHVVAALLRNCCYEVIEASNGIQAWKILEDITIHIDLVLTEVIMPFLSGIGLLTKINKTRHNLPVIMMSSHDSMSLVFKCLSKGAVDFLVKPIRKNELKILWQHVWRRCHSSSGSGSESGTQTQKSVKSRCSEKSENSGDDSEEDSESPLNFLDGSDHGSGNQGSSWTKQTAEEQVDNSGLVSPGKDISDCPDSTCAQVIHPNAVSSGDKLVTVSGAKEFMEQKELPENVEMGKALDVNTPKSCDFLLKVAGEVPVEPTSMNQNTTPNLVIIESDDQMDDGTMISTGKNLCTQVRYMGSEALSIIHDSDKAGAESKNFASIGTFPEVSQTNESKDLHIPKQSLKRLHGLQEAGNSVQDDRNVLRRSRSSAFSRYNSIAQSTSSDPRSPSNLENGLDGKSEQMCNIQSHSGSNAPAQCSNRRSFCVDMTSTSINGLNDTISLRNVSDETPPAKDISPFTFHPTREERPCPKQEPMAVNADRVDATNSCMQPRHTPQESQNRLHHHPPACSMKLQPLLGPNSVSSNIGDCGLVEGSAGYSLYGSISGSNHGSNGQNGSSTAANAGGQYNESDNGVGDKSGSGDGSGTGSGNLADQSKLSQREAAVNKFRQKRKERCFKTKVRYQSRRRLAEQRPRVRGQFVKQPLKESYTSEDTSS